jgi:hypothetical protein
MTTVMTKMMRTNATNDDGTIFYFFGFFVTSAPVPPYFLGNSGVIILTTEGWLMMFD